MHILFDIIGYHGPIILIIINSIYLIKQSNWLSIFIICSTINIGFNKLLKYVIKEPRPLNPIEFTIGENNIYTDSEKYGMPSGHMQSIAFSSLFVYMINRSLIPLLFGLIIGSLSWIQRFKYKRHTKTQLFAGTCVGLILAICSYLIIKKINLAA
jgi:hypothetical protein